MNLEKKNNKGITLTSLVVTIIIILILTTTIVTSSSAGGAYKKYKLMCADVQILEDKILVYYNKYGKLPTTGDAISENLPDVTNEMHNYYRIDVSKLGEVTLNYGKSEDVFIVDSMTMEVFYLNGVVYNGETYYTN